MAIKSNEELINATTWINLEDTVLSERSQPIKATCCMIPLIESVQNRRIQGKSRFMGVRALGKERKGRCLGGAGFLFGVMKIF